MILFPQWLVAAFVYGGIAVATAGACGLLVLLVRDFRRKRLW